MVNDRVGIGTVSPTSELEIASSAPDLELQDTTDNQNAVIAYDADKLNFWAGGTNIMTLLETGNVGIGTTSPNNLLNVGGGGVAGYDVSIATDLYVGTTIYSGNFVSAVTYIDRTPYPSSLQEAYDALMSVESKITTNGTIIDKSKLNPILLHIDEKTGEKGRDLSMTVSVLTEVVKDLKKQNDALTQALCEIKPDPELCK